MSCDERLAERVRIALWERSGVAEIRMFGGLCFMLRGNMCCGVLNDRLILRLGKEGAARALSREHTRPMDFTGKPIGSIVFVEPAGHRTDDALRSWIDEAVAFASSLPMKTGTRKVRAKAVGSRPASRAAFDAGRVGRTSERGARR